MFSSRSLARLAATALPLCLIGCASDNTSRPGELTAQVDSRRADREQEQAPTAPRVSHGVLMSAIEPLAPDTSFSGPGRQAAAPVDDPSLFFTDEQRALLTEVHDAVQEELGDHARRHRAEMRELLPLMTPRIDNETPEDRQRRDHARERLAVIRGSAPEPDDHHDRLWAAMSEPQRIYVLTSIAESRPVMPPRAEMRRGSSAGGAPPAQQTQAEAEPAVTDDQDKSLEQRVFDGGAPLDREERMRRIRRRTEIAQERLARLQAEEAAAAEAAKKASDDAAPKKDDESPKESENDHTGAEKDDRGR